jgi:hypothetical protein
LVEEIRCRHVVRADLIRYCPRLEDEPLGKAIPAKAADRHQLHILNYVASIAKVTA